jgi:hypothetical protein
LLVKVLVDLIRRSRSAPLALRLLGGVFPFRRIR